MSKIQDIKIPEGWKLDILGDDMSVQGGFAFKSSDYIDTKGIPLIRISNVGKGYIDYKSPIYLPNSYLEKYREFRLNHNDILMGLTGDLGNITLIKNKDLPALLNQRVGRFKPHNINNLYLYYLTSSSNFQNKLARFFVGGAQANISPSQIESISVLLPKDLKEQEKIAEILTTIDEDIEKTDKLIEKYKKIKAGLMEDLFTKGIDVTTGKPHTKFKDSELGRIPESWEVDSFDDFVDFFTDYTANGSFESLNKNTNVLDEKNYAYYVRLYDIRLGVGHKKQKYVDKSTFNFLSKSYLEGGEVLIANIGANVGETFLFKGDGNLATLAPNMILMRFKKNLGNYFYYYSNSSLGRKEIIKTISGSGQPKINKTDLKCAKVFRPPYKEQEKIAEILTEADGKIEKEEEYKEKLMKMKKGLMNDLLTGKVRVKF